MDYAAPGDHGVKIKENEMKKKCLNLARELKKWNMTVIGALGSILKDLVRELEELEIGGLAENSELQHSCDRQEY